MKKFLLTIALCILGIAGASAQRQAVGINLGVAPCVEKGSGTCNFGLGVKYDYNVLSRLRLEGNFDYYFEDDNLSFLDVMVHAHYLFPVGSRFNVYPIVGLGWGNLHSSWGDSSRNYSRFVFDVGIGAQFDITSRLYADFEFKYQYVKDFQRLPISVGLAYRF